MEARAGASVGGRIGIRLMGKVVFEDIEKMERGAKIDGYSCCAGWTGYTKAPLMRLGMSNANEK